MKTLTWTDETEWLALRRKVVTSTDAPILFGLKPYANSPTFDELWWEKKLEKPRPFAVTEAMKGGKVYEAAAARWIAEARGFKLADLRRTFFYDLEKGFGTSVDFGITYPWKSLLEIKCMSEQQFKARWFGGVAGFLLPQDKEIQVQWQMWGTGINEMFIGAAYCLTKTPAVAVRQANKSLFRSFEGRLRWFRESLKGHRPPAFKLADREGLPERAYA